MEKKQKFGAIVSNVGKTAKGLMNTAIQSVDQNDDGKFDFSDFNMTEANHSDVVISEMTHFPVDKAWSLLKDLKCGKLIFNHIGDPYQSAAAQENVLQQLAGLPCPVQFAFDGMSFEI